MRRSTMGRALGCAALLATALIAGSGGSAAAVPPLEPAPPALAPPAGHTLSAVFAARGVQVYQCTSGAWVFVEPAATLEGASWRTRGRQEAIHFRGPSWESTVDGSLVEARAIANSPVPGSIPELLLESTRNRGDGVFGRTSYIQRLETQGGAAPAGACVEGATAGVPYRAEYRFYSPSSGS
ncbi:DUF3455 domain-containing protein [Phytohabitans sp. ZYX-F-186]|uniref:DUF3455 domain-containing protein n=1 Tax=Phytohabitans maris TaxID=3071409 RepID=A0ABU0ZDU2_9ACTN|nr:DUF3455 domain-containing protein [Phytohabitans sp. ZYX-F-186]MDQ7904490.1 DUF3455 domain-containing protein [Phytohabitans sp. ZYX-F-186]